MRRVLSAAVLVAASLLPAWVGAQPPPAAADGIGRLLRRLEMALEAGDPAQYASLLSATADRDNASQFAADWFQPEVTRAVVRERDRAELRDMPSGQGYDIYVEALLESGRTGRVSTWRFDVRRPPGGSNDDWRIHSQEAVTTVEGLHRLLLNPAKEYAVKDLKIDAEDLELRLPQGSAFVAETLSGVTTLVLLGRGEIVFSPAPEPERGQVKIFCGAETLQARFDALFIRVNPGELEDHLSPQALQERPVDQREFRRADEIFQQDIRKSYSLDLGDLSRDTWSIVPKYGDFIAEIRTPKYAQLTYARQTSDPEDVTLFDRTHGRTISIYPSKQKLATRGPFYSEDDQLEYDVLDYDIDASFQPDREWIEGTTQLLIRTRGVSLPTLTLRLANPFVVQSVVSRRLGHLLALRVPDQNQIIINLPEPAKRDTIIDLEVTYAGHLRAVPPEREALTPTQDSGQQSFFTIMPEPSWVYSSRSYWYPQSTVSDYATATLQLRVPVDYASVASGELEDGYPRLVPPTSRGGGAWKEYRFLATQPVRYLGWAISKFVRVDSSTIARAAPPGEPGATEGNDAHPRLAGVSYNSVQLTVETNPMQQGRGRDSSRHAADALKFYASLVEDLPYPSFTLAVIERDLPGGHSPPYFATLNQPPPATPFVWRTDPANFDNFPEFFLAHELAHQWWGHAVGWKNFHEQWLSEGFAQYFAAMFAERLHGKDVFAGIVRQMGRWTVNESDQGPVYLGYRLGHLKNNSRVFRALVYNKGASVLHMLRRLVGDEAFFRGLRRFYATWRFRKAGTEDLKRAFEAEANRNLDRFFGRWIYGSTLPKIRFTYQTEPNAVALRFEQIGDVFDLPVTVTLQNADRTSSDVIVLLSEPVTEVCLPTAGTVRGVEINRDEAAPAQFVR